MSVSPANTGQPSAGQTPAQNGHGANRAWTMSGSIDFARILGGRQALSSASAILGDSSVSGTDLRLAPNAHEFADVSLFGSATLPPLYAVRCPGRAEQSGGEPHLSVPGRSEVATAEDPWASEPGGCSWRAASARSDPCSNLSIAGFQVSINPKVSQDIGPLRNGVGRQFGDLRAASQVNPQRVSPRALFASPIRASFTPPRNGSTPGPFAVTLVQPESGQGAEVVLRIGGVSDEGESDLVHRIRDELARAELRFSGLTINGRRREGVSKP